MSDKRRTRRSDRALAELAGRQHGVVSIRQLKQLGYPRSTVGDWSSGGRLHRVHRGVYAVGHGRLTWHGRCMAAVLAAQPALASHLTAAWIWGLLRSRPGTFHLTAPTRRQARSRSFVVHYGSLAGEDRARLEGIPVTALPRTLLDISAVLSPTRLEKAIERAEELGFFDLGPVDAVLARNRGHAGAGPLRRAVDLYRPDPTVTRSGLERRFRKLVRAAGLPEPAMNLNVAGFELDAYWASHRFAVELDTYETHGGPAAFERDRLRQEDLMMVGVEMTRVTDRRMKREPKALGVRLRGLLERRRRELGGV